MADSVLENKIDFTLPTSWESCTERQLVLFFNLMASVDPSKMYCPGEIKTRFLLAVNGLSVVGRNDDGNWIFEKKLNKAQRRDYGGRRKVFFQIKASKLAEIQSHIDFFDRPAAYPVRPQSFGRKTSALPADLEGVSLETFLVCDNLYQGYLQTQEESLIKELARTLYRCQEKRVTPAMTMAVFFWFMSLKLYFSSRWPEFFRQVQDSDALGPAVPDIRGAIDSLLRALTGGDPTKERAVLDLDCHRAFTELNAKAREYRELKQQSDS